MNHRFANKDGAFGLKRILASVGAFLAVIISGAAIIAALIEKEVISIAAVGYGTLMVLFLSCFVATRMSLRFATVNKVVTVSVCVVASILILILGNLILGTEKIDGFLPTLAVAVGAALSSLLTNPKAGKNRYRKNFRK